MSDFTDIHSHVIYGVDDGPRTEEEMRRMLDAAAADGITQLYATSHFTPGMHAFLWDVYESHLQKAKAYCAACGYDLAIHRGAELLYTPMMHQYITDHDLPVLGDSRKVLIEFGTRLEYRDIERAVDLLNVHGYTAVLAHIERYPCLYMPGKVARLKADYDVQCQVNSGSITHRLGIRTKLALRDWLKRELIDYVACDAHDCEHRRFRMKQAYDTLAQQVGEPYAGRLTGNIV